MIYIFRKEMHRWKNVLWLVLLSLGLGSAVGIFFRRKTPNEINIANVNSGFVSYGDFIRAFKEVKVTIDMYSNYAKAYGLPIEMFLNAEGLDNPEEKAFDTCINNELINQVKEDLSVRLDSDIFKDLLANTFPDYLIGVDGKININAYKNYLQRLGVSIPEYEDGKESEIARSVVKDIVKNSYYIPSKNLNFELLTSNYKKSFKLAVFSFEDFLKKASNVEIKDSALMEFFQKNKSNYRVAAKAQAKYWLVTPDDYEKTVVVDTEGVERYYDRNKTSLFRVSPRVKVRRIQIKLLSSFSSDQVSEKKKIAEDLLSKIQKDPKVFAELARKHSEDKDSASSGGLLDFFDKGTYDPEFERAGFRLKNSGDLSGLVKTDNSFEILQLEERIPASYKSLDKVKSEILKTLKSKKALLQLSGDIKTAMYHSKTDKQAIEKYAKSKNLKEMQTSLLSLDSSVGNEIDSMIVERLLGRQHKKHGYFVTAGKHVIYVMQKKEKSFIPKMKDIKDKIVSDFHKGKAKLSIKKEVGLAKKELLSGKLTLSDVSKKYGLKLIETGLISNTDKIKGLKVGSRLTQGMFLLNDKYQVLKKKDGVNYYLAQLVSVEDKSKDKVDKVDFAGLEKSIENQKSFVLNAFIASLFRLARIERKEIGKSLMAKQEI